MFSGADLAVRKALCQEGSIENWPDKKAAVPKFNYKSLKLLIK